MIVQILFKFAKVLLTAGVSRVIDKGYERYKKNKDSKNNTNNTNNNKN